MYCISWHHLHFKSFLFDYQLCCATVAVLSAWRATQERVMALSEWMNGGLEQGRCGHHRQKRDSRVLSKSQWSFMIWWLVQTLRVPITFESQKCYQDFLDIHNPRAVLENSLRWDNVEWRSGVEKNFKLEWHYCIYYNSSQVTFKVQLTCPWYFAFAAFPTQPSGSQEFCNADSGRLHCVERRWKRLGLWISKPWCDVTYSYSVTPWSWHNVCPFWPKAPGCKIWFGHGMWRRARLNLRDDWKVLLNFAATKNLVWLISSTW